jgi:PHD/YefM family antitoxin component YafN of YafNO toxin-antitoxin module
MPEEQFNAHINELIRRVRSIEERIAALEERQEQFRNDFSTRIISNKNQTDAILKSLSDYNKDMDTVKDEIKRMRKEMTRFVDKSKLLELEGYINILDPMNIVTKKEVKKMLEKVKK